MMSCDLVAAQDVGGILVAAAGKKKKQQLTGQPSHEPAAVPNGIRC